MHEAISVASRSMLPETTRIVLGERQMDTFQRVITLTQPRSAAVRP